MNKVIRPFTVHLLMSLLVLFYFLFLCIILASYVINIKECLFNITAQRTANKTETENQTDIDVCVQFNMLFSIETNQIIYDNCFFLLFTINQLTSHYIFIAYEQLVNSQKR